MKRNLKVIALVTAVVFILVSAMTACTSGSKETVETSDSSVAAGTAAVSGLEPYELDFYLQTSSSKDIELVQQAMNKILTEKINATVVLHSIDSGTWNDKTKLMFASRDKIDVISSASWLNYTSNVANNAYLSVDDLLTQYGKDIIDAFGMDYIKGTAVKGKIYGIPVLKEQGYSVGYVFKKDLVEKYNFDLSTVKTYKDIEPMLEVIKQKEPDITPLCESGLNVPGLIVTGIMSENLGSHAGGALLINSDDYKLVNLFENQEFLDSLDWIHEMYKKGYINKSSLTDTEAQSPMAVGDGFCMPQSLKPGKDSELSVQWGYPVVQVDLMTPYTPANQATGFMESIGSTSEDPARAMMFLNLLYSDKELLNTLVFGVENTHYQKISDSIIDYLSGQDSKTVGWSAQGWMFGNQLNNYLWKNEDPEKWKKFKEFNTSSKVSRVLGFTFDPTNVATEISAINNIDSQYRKAISCGAADPVRVVPEYLDKLKSAGYDKVMAEKQKQLDEWVKANKQ